jgi:glycosyltransferase involved in cell wall biosynthesis
MIRDKASGRSDVVQLDFQPNDELPDVLASGDVLVALLEPDASRFSVPSKVCSYLAAGRPVLALTPDSNPCTPLVNRSGGMVAYPDKSGTALAGSWAAQLAHDPDIARQIGSRARELAMAEFAINPIVDAFERMLHKADAPRAFHSDLRNP